MESAGGVNHVLIGVLAAGLVGNGRGASMIRKLIALVLATVLTALTVGGASANIVWGT